MRTSQLILGAVILALVAGGLLIWTNPAALQSLLPFLKPNEEQLMSDLAGIASRGGHVATFSQQGAQSWRLAQGHRLERFSLNDRGAVFARLSSSTHIDPNSFDWPNLGLSWVLTREFNNQSNGKRIEIGVVARRAQANSSDSVYLMYATQQAGNTGWKPIPLSTQFELHRVPFDVPNVEGGFANPPILVLHADPTAKGKSVEILGVYVQLAPAN